MSGVMTVDEAAAYLKLHPRTVRAMYHEGVLPGNQYKRAIRLDAAAVVEWARHRGKAARTGTDP